MSKRSANAYIYEPLGIDINRFNFILIQLLKNFIKFVKFAKKTVHQNWQQRLKRMHVPVAWSLAG